MDDVARRAWSSTAGSAFVAQLTALQQSLATVSPALREAADILRAHARATDDAVQAVQQARVAMLTVAELQATDSDGGGDDAIAEESRVYGQAVQGFAHAIEVFHSSEKRAKQVFWDLGARTPAPLPLPALPVAPERSWWQKLIFGDEPPPTWENQPLHPPVDGWTGAIGYDEDGLVVPAYQADVPWTPELLEAGIPVGPILKWLARGGRTMRTLDEGALIAREAIETSYGFRDSHIDRHIREWYRLGEGEPVPPWMKKEYLDMLGRATARSQRVFAWTTGDSQTVAAVHFDQETGRWLVVQFHTAGKYAGQFATSFEPTASQLDAMLRQGAVGLP
jgi:hypothetical protein